MLVACLCTPGTHIPKGGGSCILCCKDEKFCLGSQVPGEAEVAALPQAVLKKREKQREKKRAAFAFKAYLGKKPIPVPIVPYICTLSIFIVLFALSPSAFSFSLPWQTSASVILRAWETLSLWRHQLHVRRRGAGLSSSNFCSPAGLYPALHIGWCLLRGGCLPSKAQPELCCFPLMPALIPSLSISHTVAWSHHFSAFNPFCSQMPLT